MNRSLFLTILVSLFILPISGFSAETFVTKDTEVCGGHIVVNEDCASRNNRFWHVSCCEEGYRTQGVQYADHYRGDAVDTVTAVCRSVSKGNTVINNDDFGQENKVKYQCKKTEILSGIMWRDVKKKNGKEIDSMDSITPICMNPADGSTRIVPNKDGDNGGKTYKDSIKMNYKVVGIATKERLGDTADCSALIVAPRKK